MSIDVRLPAVLRRQVEQRQCVAFVGAGLSAAIGMPGWGGLLRALCDDVADSSFDNSTDGSVVRAREAIDRGEFTLAASILRPLFSGADLNRAIAQKFDMQVFQQSPISVQQRMLKRLENLISIPWAGIVSTNFDLLIEHGISLYSVGNYVQANPFSDNFGDILSSNAVDERFFVKLHGSVAGAGYVLGTEEYDRVYLSTPRSQTFLSAIMLRYSVVFIGSSLEDDILRIRRKLSSDFGGKIPTAYALLPRNSTNEGRRQWLLDQAQVISMLYGDTNATTHDHQEVDKFLSELRDVVDPVYSKDNADFVSGTAAALLKLPIKDRIGAIGVANADLMQLISAGGDAGLSHASLLAPNTRILPNIDKSIFGMSPEERVYRVMFLISIKLVRIRSVSREGRCYSVVPEALKLLD